MTSAKDICVLGIACLTVVSALSISYTPQSKGRKLFGGYRIVPKICQPTNPSSIKSNEPSICMFNYECSRRNGEVVGACMDGFLFGACCQLPPGDPQSSSMQYEKSPNTDYNGNLHEIDHVPDIPILLNSDGTPIGISASEVTGTTKITTYGSANHQSHSPGSYTKITTLNPQSATSDNAKPNANVNLSQLEEDFSTLLGNQEILDDLRLPGLITHTNNDIQDHQGHSPVSPVTTLLSPDQILQIADPVDQLPALFAQGFAQNNHTGADTVLLNENGTLLSEKNNPDDLFKPQHSKNLTDYDKTSFPEMSRVTLHQTSPSPSSTVRNSQSNKQADPHTTTMVQQYANVNRITMTTSDEKYTNEGWTFSKIPMKVSNPSYFPENQDNPNAESSVDKITVTTPMATTRDDDSDNDDLVRVPTITYESGNKKNDEQDQEEIAINHILSILNATTPSGPTKMTQQVENDASSLQSWASLSEEGSQGTTSNLGVSKPSATTEMFPYTFYHPGRPSTYYHYDTQSTQSSDGSSLYSTLSSSTLASSRPSSSQNLDITSPYGSSSSYSYSTRPSVNPPAPTVIVLGPLGTEYTAITTQKPTTRKPTTGSIRPSLVTKSPSIGTTITHNISTVISTSSAATSNNHVVSTSYISVNLKDNTSPKPVTPTVIHAAVESDTDVVDASPATKSPSTIWTTLSSWSSKPSFHLKPTQSDTDVSGVHKKPIHSVFFKDTTPVVTTAAITKAAAVTQASTICDDETPAPDDLINFPPVRNPNLTQQEKPTLVESSNNTDFPETNILNNNDIPTPSFIEDDVLTNKVDAFVHKIVESLGDNFQDLKEILYAKKNATLPAPQTNNATKKPPSKKPVAKPPTGKPAISTTIGPVTKRPTKLSGAGQKPAEKPTSKPIKNITTKPKPSGVSNPTTKKPQITATKRPKPAKKPTSPVTTTTTAIPETVEEETEPPVVESTQVSTVLEDTPLDYSQECGVRPLFKSGRIVGGKGASFGAWPWQVLVREATWLGLFTKNKCGGVLLTNKYVVTAAHCQPGFLATLVAVFGEFDISGELESKRSITRNVRRVIVNRGYNPATFENDLAILELEKPIQFDAHIVPICMPEDDTDFTGRLATVTGWGRVKYNGGTPSVLQEVQVPIIKNSVCQDMFRTAGHSKLILDSFLCAGYASGQKDSCEGDSGGPLMMQRPDGRWILVGTVSHGIKCAAPYLPGVYMKTTFFKPWLHTVTGV